MDKKLSDNLYKAILTLENLSQARNFFRDLLTEEEIAEFSRRWQAAKMLEQKIPYEKIVDETGLSSRTVARISKWLNAGTGGYRQIINKLHRHSSFLKKELS